MEVLLQAQPEERRRALPDYKREIEQGHQRAHNARNPAAYHCGAVRGVCEHIIPPTNCSQCGRDRRDGRFPIVSEFLREL
jgi:hypothetical protein